MTTEEPIAFKVDKELILSNPEFGTKLNTHQYDSNEARLKPFPTDYTLAEFSNQAYKSRDYNLPGDWEFLTTAYNKNLGNGYFGVALWNPKLCHIAIAHRGTKPIIGAAISDIQLTFNAYSTQQSQSAATFVHLVSEEIKKRRDSGDKCRFQLSITGHSLGAWLAQITTFTVKYFKVANDAFVEDTEYLENIHVHTVVFESPGCKEGLSKLAKKFVARYVHRKFGNFDNLDMSVYLSRLNPINSINHHVGSIYMVESKTHSIQGIIELFDPESHTINRNIVLDFKSGLYASGKLLLKYLLPSTWTKQNVILRSASNLECSLNVFNENELDFVYDWQYAVKRNSVIVKEYKETRDIPDFEINHEYNIIQANDLYKAIASIKFLHPTKDTILDLLESDVDNQIHIELFKLEAEHFQESILQFKRYYFKDRYGLKEYLTSDDKKILHILINENSALQYELETSIVSNVLKNYSNNKLELFDNYYTTEGCSIVIINWRVLSKSKNFLSKIIGKTKDKINLLIVECFEIQGRNEDMILKCLSESGAKVILISVEDFQWLHAKGVKTVSGYGGNIRFQDLTKESQEEFRKQPILSLYGKTLCLDDILKEEDHFENEVYEYLNKAVLVLLEFMLTPIMGQIVMDCPYNNVMFNTVYLDVCYEIDIEMLISRSYDDEVLFLIEDQEELELLKWINNPNIQVQPKIVLDKKTMHNIYKVVYFLKTEKGKLYLIRIFNKNFYIPRNIIYNSSVNPQFMFSSLNTDLDMYFFCGDISQYRLLHSQLTDTQKGRFQFFRTLEEGKQKLKNLGDQQKNVHLFTINADKIEWLCSQGNLNSIRKYMQPNKISSEETEIINHNRQVCIISGEPGIGKSSTIGNLFLKLRRTHWVFTILLRNSHFDDIDDNIDFDIIAKFILRTCSNSTSDCLKYLLSYCLKNKSKLEVYLLLDGFDEIPTYQDRDKLVKMINFLRENSHVKMVITTRRFACKALENGLSMFASSFEMINYNTKILDFFAEFQYTRYRLFENTTFSESRAVVTRIMESVLAILGEKLTDFIGIPMQMRMIAEVLTSLNALQVSKIAVENILSLYEKYTDIHCNTYFKRTSISPTTTINQWLKECIFTKLCKLAIIKFTNFEYIYPNEDDLNELNKTGLIQSDNEYNKLDFEFLHSSVRDFFIAYLLKMWLKGEVVHIHHSWDIETFIVSDFLMNGACKEIRFFMNSYLKNIEIPLSSLNKCSDKILELFQKNANLLTDIETQETIFHLCVRENLCYLVKYFIFKIIDTTNKVELLSKRNVESQTPLLLAIYEAHSNNSENILLVLLEELDKWNKLDLKNVFVSTLFINSKENDTIRTIKNYSSTYKHIYNLINQIEQDIEYIGPFLYACRENNYSKVNEILEVFKNDKITRDYLLLTTMPGKKTGLHLTISKDIAEKLLKLRCPKDMQDSHGMTPLNRAIKNKQTEIAIKLINKGVQNISDNYGFTPVLQAAKYDNLDVLKMLISKNPNINIDEENIFGVTALMVATKYGNESIVKYLVDKGAKVFATDKHGNNCVHYAAMKGNTRLISLLKKHGADINALNNIGVTPLLYSLQQNKKNMINCLLNNGADVNVCSTKKIYPIQILIEKQENSLLLKILKEEHIKIVGGNTITRAAARTDILTTEELDYINNLTKICKIR